MDWDWVCVLNINRGICWKSGREKWKEKYGNINENPTGAAHGWVKYLPHNQFSKGEPFSHGSFRGGVDVVAEIRKNANAGGTTTAQHPIESSSSNSIRKLLRKAASGSSPVGTPIQDILLFLFSENLLVSCCLKLVKTSCNLLQISQRKSINHSKWLHFGV